MYMRCIPLKQVPSAEYVDSRLRKAVKEMRRRYAFWVPYSGFYESLCISHERIELIFYIDMRKNIEECADECMVHRRKMHEICIKRGEECWEFDEEAEREFCRSSCEQDYIDDADMASYEILKSLDVMREYGIKYRERISYPSPYETLIRVDIRLR
jgi:hypothetical protein